MRKAMSLPTPFFLTVLGKLEAGGSHTHRIGIGAFATLRFHIANASFQLCGHVASPPSMMLGRRLDRRKHRGLLHGANGLFF